MRIGRIHHADIAAFQLQLGWVLFKKIFLLQIAFAIAAQNHVGGGDGKHIGLQFNAVQLVLADMAFLRFIFGLLQHMVHGSNQKSSRATTGVKYAVIGFQIGKFAKQFHNVLGS